MDKKKKIKAAIAGVMHLLSLEKQETMTSQPVAPANYAAPWALLSRQTIMHNRRMMQQRTMRRN